MIFRIISNKYTTLLSVLIFMAVPIIAQEKKTEQAKIIFVIGDVSLKENGKTIDLKKEKEVPISAQLTSAENGKLEFEYERATYIIHGKQNIKLLAITWKQLFKTSGPTFALGVRGFQDSWNSLLKESAVAYSEYIKGRDVKDYKNWNAILDKTFTKLIYASGSERFTPQYAIIQDDQFNAGAFPGGQFIIHTGTLDIIDVTIEKELKTFTDETKDTLREKYISSILAHELAHYLNKHAFNARKRILGHSEDGKPDNQYILSELKYSQENELDADSTGLLFLQKAGYDSIWMVRMLKMVNEVEKKNSGKISPYFSTHPSTYTRLSSIPNDDQEFHKWISKMEYVFADIQLGKNLESSSKELESALKKYPNNKELLKASAVCKHKLWLETVSLEDQMLRSIIDLPSFRDNMVTEDGSTRRAGREIPGDRMKYYDAIKAYEIALGQFPDAYFLSNFSNLLIYSDDDKTIEKGIFFAEVAHSLNSNVQTANNLGVAYFVSDKKKEEALAIFAALATRTDIKHFVLPDLKSQIIKEQDLKNALDKAFVADEFTPILNLALSSVYLKKEKIGKEISEKYIKQIDSYSKWASFLSELTAIQIPKEKLSDEKISIEKIELGSSQTKLKEVSFKNEVPLKMSFEQNSKKAESLNFFKTGISFTVESEKIIQIKIYREGLTLNNGLSVGMSITDAEKILATKNKRSGEYYLYQGKSNNLALRVIKDKVAEIIVFK